MNYPKHTLPIFCLLASGNSPCLAASQESRPNVIYILMDDLGYGELGCYGQECIETPHIDQLAQGGIRFTQFYTAAPVSAPARCMLLTGKHSGQAAIRGNNELAHRGNVWSHQAMLQNPHLEGQMPLPQGTRTFAHRLQDAGYQTAMIGKWGLGYPGSHATPNKMGFDFFYGYNCQRQAHTYYPMFLYRNEKREMLNNAPLLHPHAKLDQGADPYDEASYAKFSRKEYSNDLMFRELQQYISQSKKQQKPFMLMWTTPLPHVGLQAPKEWVDYYQKKFNETQPYLGQQSYLPCRYPRATYAAMLSYFDAQVGELIEQLKREGIYENTLIIFSSDNGPTFNGGSSSPWFKSAAPFKSEQGWGKASLREGGIRVPLIISWPAQIKKPKVSEHICAAWDIYPTLTQIARAPQQKELDGISLLPTILGKTQKKHKALYWEFPEGTGSRALRMGKWKGFISNIKKGNKKIQLFDLEKDPQEQHNLAEKHPRIVEQIHALMQKAHTPPTEKQFRFFEKK